MNLEPLLGYVWKFTEDFLRMEASAPFLILIQNCSHVWKYNGPCAFLIFIQNWFESHGPFWFSMKIGLPLLRFLNFYSKLIWVSWTLLILDENYSWASWPLMEIIEYFLLWLRESHDSRCSGLRKNTTLCIWTIWNLVFVTTTTSYRSTYTWIDQGRREVSSYIISINRKFYIR